MSEEDRWLSQLPRRWHLGVIVGGTGTGKTRALHELRNAGLISKILSASASAADWPAELAVVSVIAASELVAKEARKVIPCILEPAPPLSLPHSLLSSTTLTSTSPPQSTDDFFGTEPTAEERAAHAILRLSASGLNSLGPWRLPYRALSNGQQARADVARVASSHLALDDFGATVEALSAAAPRALHD